MSLVVATNVSALYSQNALKTNARTTATTMERLSTGVRVNSAKDDAAGLAIGQNMTSQIRGLDQAVRNINDGINLVQTAEGGLNSVSNILQRIRELTVQAANGTNSDGQRSYIQQEVNALKIQIDQVTSSTTWNDKQLLMGNFKQSIQIGANLHSSMEINIPGFDSAHLLPMTSGTTEYANIQFPPLSIGQSITVNGLTFLATQNVTDAQIASAFENLQPGDTAGGGSTYGNYQGSLVDYISGIASGNQLLMTSTTPLQDVPDISVSTAGINQVQPPTVETIRAPTTPVQGRQENATITFPALLQGQAIAIGGLKFTAGRALIGTEVADAFANLQNGATTGPSSANGLYSGVLNGYYSSPANSDVIVIKSVQNANVNNISVQAFGMPGTAPTVVTSNGAVGTAPKPEEEGLKFPSLIMGQSVKVNNLTFTATKNITAYEVASAFSNLNINSTSGPGTVYGTYTGQLQYFHSGLAVGDSVTFKCDVDIENATDDIVHSSNITINKYIEQIPGTGKTETSTITFPVLNAGQHTTVSGLTFTANINLSSAQVAAAFAGLSPNDMKGSTAPGLGAYTGIFNGNFWTGPSSNAAVTAYSTILLADVPNIQVSGSTVLSAPQAPVVLVQDGISDIPGSAQISKIIFNDMKIGQSLTISGIKFDATSDLSADQVAAAFANIADGNTAGNATQLGNYSGALSGFSSGSPNGNSLSFICSQINVNIVDLPVTVGSSIGAPIPPVVQITQGITNPSSMDNIDAALDLVNSTRATLGSYLNTLAYAADNLTNISSNATQSRGTIMDADYAEETANLAKSQIIQHAATAMLAQANQQPQSVLALLKNL